MGDIDVSPLFNKLSLALYKESIERMKASGNFYNNVHVDLKSIDDETWFTKIYKRMSHKQMKKIMYINIYIDHIVSASEINSYISIINNNKKMLEECLSYIFDFDIKEKLREYDYNFIYHDFKSNNATERFYNEIIIPELLLQQLKSSI